MAKRARRIPTCHPDRKHEAKGLCKNCYLSAWFKTPQGEETRRRGKESQRKRLTPEQREKAARRYHLKRSFGITLEDYEKMLTKQDGTCGICNQKCSSWASLAVDHDHSTGEIRGLLCFACNIGLGKFKDSPSLLQKALDYLTPQQRYKKGKP